MSCLVSAIEKAVLVPAAYLKTVSAADRDAFIKLAEEINYHLLVTFGEDMATEAPLIKQWSKNVQALKQPAIHMMRETVMEHGFCPDYVTCCTGDENEACLLREEGLTVYEAKTENAAVLIKKLRDAAPKYAA